MYSSGECWKGRRKCEGWVGRGKSGGGGSGLVFTCLPQRMTISLRHPAAMGPMVFLCG